MRRQQQRQLDAQLYSTAILDQLQQSKQWKSVDEIVQITLRAVTDLLQTHAQSLQDIKAVLTTRASKTELTTGLSLKTNVSDVSKTVEELSDELQQRPTHKDLAALLRQYPSRSDLTGLLADRVHAQPSQQENLQLTILKTRMDQFQKEITKKVSICVTLNEFQGVLNVLEEKANVNEINEALEGKVSKQYLTAALQKKVSKSELDSAVSKKADTADLDYLVAGLESKVSVATLQKLTQVLQNKADKSDLVLLSNERTSHQRSHQRALQDQWFDRLQQTKSTLSLQMKELRKELQLQGKQWSSSIGQLRGQLDTELRKHSAGVDSQISKKVTKQKGELMQQVDALRQYCKNLQEELVTRSKAFSGLSVQLQKKKRVQETLYEQIDQLAKKIQQVSIRSVEKKEFIGLQSQVAGLLQRDDIDLMQAGFDKFQVKLTHKMRSQRTEMQQIILRNKQQIMNEVSTVGQQLLELRKGMARRQERGEWEQLVRSNRRDIQQFRKTVDHLYAQTNKKLTVSEYEGDLMELRKRFEQIGRQLKEKANITDVCVLCDSKPNIEDVNSALREINQALSERVTQSDLQSMAKDQAVINETLCAQSIVGRWLWQSGETKAGGLLLWQHQAANTVPDHFFWEKDKTSILIITGGVYEMTACVFGTNCSLAILANGDALNPVRGEQNVNSMNKKKGKKREKSEGSTHVRQYCLLPARSRVSVSCSGQAGEGFLNIRRL